MGLSGTIERGDYFFKTIELDGDLTITGGNFMLCRVDTNGHALDIQGGNVRGLYIDEVKQDDYVWRKFEPLDQATDLNNKLRAKGGDEGVEAFQTGIIEWLHANPPATYQQWSAAYILEATVRGWFANVSTIQKFVGDYLNKTEWAPFVALVLNYTPDQWAGKDTELVEEYS